MGQNTDALMDTCSKLALALDPLVKKIAGEIKQTKEKVLTLQNKAKPWKGELTPSKNDAANWLEELKEVKSDRDVVAKNMEILKNSALSKATKAAKDLESKIKKKDFLNFFKNQQSLDNAKKAAQAIAASHRQCRATADKILPALRSHRRRLQPIDGPSQEVLEGGLGVKGTGVDRQVRTLPDQDQSQRTVHVGELSGNFRQEVRCSQETQ